MSRLLHEFSYSSSICVSSTPFLSYLPLCDNGCHLWSPYHGSDSTRHSTLMVSSVLGMTKTINGGKVGVLSTSPWLPICAEGAWSSSKSCPVWRRLRYGKLVHCLISVPLMGRLVTFYLLDAVSYVTGWILLFDWLPDSFKLKLYLTA